MRDALYSLLPRQYIATELFERVEVLRGASAFLNGATPGGGVGGAINLLPKRAPNEPLTRVTTGAGGTPLVEEPRKNVCSRTCGVTVNDGTAGCGGEEEDRTPDLRIANATLSQLSYPPTAQASLAQAPDSVTLRKFERCG